MFNIYEKDNCMVWELRRKDPLAQCDALVVIQRFKESLKSGPWIYDKSAVVMFKGPHRPPLPGEPGHWANDK